MYEAKALLERSQTIFERLETAPLAGLGTDPLASLGVVANTLGDYSTAINFGQQARQGSAARGDKWNLTLALYVLLTRLVVDLSPLTKATIRI